jgi:iron complex outermembrane receptor protein
MALALAASLTTSFAIAAEAPAAPPGSAPEAGQSATVGEIVVTAERRETNLETTPVAVSAFTAQQRDLLGIQSVQDLTDYTPGLAYTTFDNRPYIRGIGRQSDNLAVESGVAVYVDGIYFGANASTILQLDTLFVERIDILRGPQSTLYGRNADGGAINYISRRPTQELQAEMRTGYDNYDKYYVEGAVSGPIDDHLRFLAGGNYTRQDGGYYPNLTGSPEGGSVAQGGNGHSYHVEFQLAGDFGSSFDWWFKAATNDYNTSYHTETLQGPLDTREFYDPLMPNQNYGLCLLPGSSANPGCGAANPDTLVSVTTLPGTSATNPSATDTRAYQADFFSHARERDNLILNFTADWHAPWFDVKYLGGFQTFKYYLNAPWLYSQGVSSSVESYQLAAPTAPTALCSALFSTNLAGCTQNLTVYPAQTQFTFVEDESFFSHELDFQSRGNGRLQWLAGLYWYHENYNQPVNVLDPNQPQVKDPLTFTFAPAAANPSGSVYNEDTRLVENSEAAFMQLDWAITNTIKLTGGMRYTADQKFGEEAFRVVLFNLEAAGLGVNSFGANTPAFDATACPAPGPEAGGLYPGAGPCVANPNGGVERHLNAHWQALTGTVNLSWQPTPDTLTYARYSRGYKTGGFNSGTVTVYPLTAPETVDAFEVGFKNTYARVFQTNISAFYYDYFNDQQPLGVDVSGVVDTLITNLPVVHTYGVELENTWQATRRLTVGLNYAYLHSAISDMKGICIQDTADPDALAPGANTTGCGSYGPGFQNLTGQNLPEAPHNKVSLTGVYRIPFQPGTLTFSGAFVYKSGEYDSPFNRSYNYAPAYTQVNTRISFTDASNRYTVMAFCDNLFNTLGYDGAVGIPVSAAGANQVIDRLASFTAPRTFGVELQYRWR